MKFWVQKKSGKLWPYKVEDQIKMNKLPLEPILVKHTKIRNPRLHRKYFAFIRAVYHNLPEKYNQNWPTQRSFRKSMEMYAGHYEEVISLKGERMLHPKSIAYESLDGHRFEELYEEVRRIIAKHIVPWVDDIENEIGSFYE